MPQFLRLIAPRFLMLALFAASVSAPASAATNYFKERKGGKDHPLVSRFQGAILHNYGVVNFEQVKVPLSATKDETIEGKVYSYFYVIPADRTGLEVYRNYKAALEKSGFQILVACEDERDCEKQRLHRHATDWTGRAATSIHRT